ncbi:hypothetical protein J23TS9_17170 [Paenibacillus sp. J23TS9]|uniref:Ig-like domain-containing protein n=1 Tax=Paenibacillus sp. J23TS9 TaxID=2807193 RepID=UPI001B17A959|nr:Ig-like domain-containing protein [Paenibacillus sp. J23TS9]GIP26587.1 hypothetical protein J23TS9_17170 [Paenibacillus sp. J23TS9]
MGRFLSKMLTVCMTASLLMYCGVGFDKASADGTQSVVEWTRDYGSISSGEGVISTSDGGYLATGNVRGGDKDGDDSFQKAYVLKLNAKGQVKWEQKLAHSYSSNTAYLATETKDGGYLVLGSSRTEGESKDELYMIRLDSSGNVLWDKTKEDAAIDSTPVSVIETDDGSFLIAGRGIVSWVAYEQAYILKIDANGNEVWYNKYPFTGSDFFNDLIPAIDGGYIAIGHAGLAEYESKDYDAMLILKLDDQGKEVWSKQFIDPKSRWTAHSIVAAEDGGYVVLSRKKMDDKNLVLLTKLDLEGQVQWEKTYSDGENSEMYNRLVRTKDGYAMLGGHNSRNSLNESKTQYGVLSVNVNGGVISRDLFKGPPITYVGKAAGTPDGGFIFPGTVTRGDTHKFQVMKLSPPAEGTPAERALTGISFTDKEKRLKAGTSAATVLQAVYSDGSKEDLSSAGVYVSGDSAVATIDALGRISGNEPGETYVEATFEGFTSRLNITVLPKDTDEFDPVSGYIKLDSGEYSILEGSMLDLKVTLYDYKTNTESDITKLTTFTSNHPDIAEVDEEGNLIGHKLGVTRIYAQYKGSRISADVQVVRAAFPQEKMQPSMENSEHSVTTE